MDSDVIVWLATPIAALLVGFGYKRLSKRWQVRLRRWLPSPGSMLLGLLLAMYGFLTLHGATITVQIEGGSEPGVSEIPKFTNPVVSWLMVALGFDFMLTGGRFIVWVLGRVVTPVLSRALTPMGTALKESDIGQYVQERFFKRCHCVSYHERTGHHADGCPLFNSENDSQVAEE